jgi:hypothetical protein
MDNTAILSRGNAIYALKKAKKKRQPEELKFDPESRLYRSYLLFSDYKRLLDWISKTKSPTASESCRTRKRTSSKRENRNSKRGFFGEFVS